MAFMPSQRDLIGKLTMAFGAAVGMGPVFRMSFEMTAHAELAEFVQSLESEVGKWAEQQIGIIRILLELQKVLNSLFCL